jgi:hypothetical protein
MVGTQALDFDPVDTEAGSQPLIEAEPADPLLKLAYWTAINDQSREGVFEAARDLRLSGATWHVVAMAHGERSHQATRTKFHAYIQQTADPAKD